MIRCYTLPHDTHKYDQFSKEFLAGLLDPFGTTAIDVAINSEVREIDLLFTPLMGADPSGLGLLGRISPKLLASLNPTVMLPPMRISAFV